MKSIKNLITLFGFLISSCLFPQSYSIEGIVVDDNGQALELATVFVYENDASTLVLGATTEKGGHFKMQLAGGVEYVLVASFLEHRSAPVPFALSNHKNLGTIAINTENNLSEVSVVAEKPKLERKVDRYVFKVQNTSLVQGTIADVLSRTPGLLAINGQLNYKGETGIGIMINEKLINLPEQNVWDMLTNAPAGAIKSIEVITNPPAKYSAEGTILVNIVMEGNLVAGYNGGVNIGFGQGNFPKYTIGTDHFFKTKKTALTLSYGYSDRKGTNRFVDNTNFSNNGIISNWDADQNRVRNTTAHSVNVFYDQKLSERTSFSVALVNMITPTKNLDINTNTQIMGPNDENFTNFLSKNTLLRNELSSSTFLDIDHKFPNTKNRLSAAVHFTYFEKEREQDIANAFFDAEGDQVDEIDFNTFSGQQIRLATAQLDYDAKMGKTYHFSTGLKFAGIDSNSDLFQNGTEGLSNNIGATNGSFNYDEQIYAAYGNLDFSWQNTDVALGLRMEYTESQGTLVDNGEVFKNVYLEWFPNFSIKHDLEKERSLLLYYYRRITRPRYEQINPFQLFQSYNSTVEGNPRLQPATRHYLAAGYNFNKWIGFEFFYRYRRNQLRTLTYQDNSEKIVRFINANVNRELGYGFDVIVNKKITSFWSTYLIASYYYLGNRFQDLESGVLGTTSGWTFNMTNNNNFSFLQDRDLTVDFDIQYRSTLAFGNTKSEPYGSVNLSFRKQLWNGNGSISAGVTDIFSQRAYMERRRFLNQDNSSFIDPETPVVNINFRYKFGNTAMESNKKRKRQGEVDRI